MPPTDHPSPRSVSSSEKVDKQERYADFELLSLPYPGCEFFQQYCQHGYQDSGLMFDWNQSYIDAEVVLPPPLQDRPAVPWHLYRVSPGARRVREAAELPAVGSFAELEEYVAGPRCHECGFVRFLVGKVDLWPVGEAKFADKKMSQIYIL